MRAATLDERIELASETLAELLAPAGTGPGVHTAGKFDSRPTWDKLPARPFDSRPSWDNWHKK